MNIIKYAFLEGTELNMDDNGYRAIIKGPQAEVEVELEKYRQLYPKAAYCRLEVEEELHRAWFGVAEPAPQAKPVAEAQSEPQPEVKTQPQAEPEPEVQATTEAEDIFSQADALTGDWAADLSRDVEVKLRPIEESTSDSNWAEALEPEPQGRRTQNVRKQRKQRKQRDERATKRASKRNPEFYKNIKGGAK